MFGMGFSKMALPFEKRKDAAPLSFNPSGLDQSPSPSPSPSKSKSKSKSKSGVAPTTRCQCCAATRGFPKITTQCAKESQDPCPAVVDPAFSGKPPGLRPPATSCRCHPSITIAIWIAIWKPFGLRFGMRFRFRFRMIRIGRKADPLSIKSGVHASGVHTAPVQHTPNEFCQVRH
jgi:hypothetical protein